MEFGPSSGSTNVIKDNTVTSGCLLSHYSKPMNPILMCTRLIQLC